MTDTSPPMTAAPPGLLLDDGTRRADRPPRRCWRPERRPPSGTHSLST